MGGVFGGSKSESKSEPVDVTPPEFERLRGPVSDTLNQLLSGGGQRRAGGGQTLSAPQVPGFPSRDTAARVAGTSGNRMARGAFRTMQAQGRAGGQTEEFGPNLPQVRQGGGQQQQGGGILGGIPQFQGDLTADMAEGERRALEAIEQFATGDTQRQQTLERIMQGGGQEGQDPFTETLRTIAQEGAQPQNIEENPFLQDVIESAQRQTRQQLTETLERTLPGRFTQAGQFVQPGGSSAFDRAAAIATRGAAGEMSDIASDIGFRAFESGRQAQLQELGSRMEAAQAGLDQGRQETQQQLQAAQISQQEIDSLVENLRAQALPRLIQQEGIDRGLELFNTRLNSLLQSLQIAAPAAAQFSQRQESEQSGPGFGRFLISQGADLAANAAAS